jgi:hypothetical protein
MTLNEVPRRAATEAAGSGPGGQWHRIVLSCVIAFALAGTVLRPQLGPQAEDADGIEVQDPLARPAEVLADRAFAGVLADQEPRLVELLPQR